MMAREEQVITMSGETPSVEPLPVKGGERVPLHRPAKRVIDYLLSNAVRYNLQTITTAIMAATASGICALLGWPIWAMFLGWVGSFSARDSLKDAARSYFCLVAGIGIGAIGTLALSAMNPIIGPLAAAVTVLGMATIIVSMRKLPIANIVPSYILGVLGIFALHASFSGIALVKIAGPSFVGSIGVWLASRLQIKIANFSSTGHYEAGG